MAVLLVAMQNSFAQTFFISPQDTIEKYGVFEDLETLSIKQVNNSVNPITLQWSKVSESLPALWEATVCDNSNCNTSLVDSGTMAPILPFDSSFLLLHITPHVNYGAAIVKYAVWDILTPNLKDTLTYILKVNNSSGISETENGNQFSIFPNPASDFINIFTQLKNGLQYSLMNILGHEILNGKSSTNHTTINIKNLDVGFYLLSIHSDNNILPTQKVLIQK